MKNVLLSADGPLSVYSVPDDVADSLWEYCLEFIDWLHHSPDAEAYVRDTSTGPIICFDESDFIDYLNQYVFQEQSTLVAPLRLAESLPLYGMWLFEPRGHKSRLGLEVFAPAG